jgi:hypothetical protein
VVSCSQIGEYTVKLHIVTADQQSTPAKFTSPVTAQPVAIGRPYRLDY